MAEERPSTSSHPKPATVVPASPSRCPQCNPPGPQHNKNSRNLVVCIDGTCNEFGQENTNVVKLFAQIDLQTRSPKQFAYYSSGIGTDPNSQGFIKKFLDMAIGWNIKEIIKDAYRWLADKYEEGDQIYLFGFSRGAYQVRVLAGMIREVGLIRTPTEKQIKAACDYFEAIRSGKPKTRQIAREFKNTFSWKDLRVHFVGVWDTVASVGLLRSDLFLSTSSSATHACHFRHALALDERRVCFMPEYFHEMNSQMDSKKFKGIVSSDIEDAASPADEAQITTDENQIDCSSGQKSRTLDIKEVWFAGCHSDVGGTSKPGRSHLSGNASLLWMRQEATESGLKLQPTDLVWVPDDLNFGTSDSMHYKWLLCEYIPFKHQVSFSGPGEDGQNLHLSRPRRIIPGQKVHASILFANAYAPQATLGEGFDIPLMQAEDTTELDDQIWERGLFDETAARMLVGYLGRKEGVAPIYLDRLLFMLRFKEGKECVRKVLDWRKTFTKLIMMRDHEYSPLVRLVAILAYYEVSCDPDTTNSPAPTDNELLANMSKNAKDLLCGILDVEKHRDGPRILALLRPLTRHQALRKHILVKDVLEKLIPILDTIVGQRGGNFGQAMDGLICLLQYADTRKTIVEKLGANCPSLRVSRLSRILETNNPQLLTAALRMVLTLVRIPAQEVPEARDVCSAVESKLKQLAKRDERPVGPLAVKILLALHDPNGQKQLAIDIWDKKVQANLGSALVHLQPERRKSGDESGRSADPVLQTLRQLFGLDAETLTDQHEKLIDDLKEAAEKRNARERTVSTMTLLKLCESETIRNYLREINLLDLFIDQLQRKDRALVAAYALAACLKYADMKQSVIVNEKLPRNIVDMLRLDYFDDAVGPVEGFQIFGDLMHDDDLQRLIRNHDITGVLDMKLGNGKLKEIRTSLVCLDVFRSLDKQGPWTRELVENSLNNLRDLKWDVQKAGVTILSALARTDHGIIAIEPKIVDIVEMLLPEGYLPNPPAQPDPVKPLSWIMGPACALRILAQNPVLRRKAHDTSQYSSLKHLCLSGTLVDNKSDTLPWKVKTPNRSDVIDILDKMIKAVDGELLEEDLIPIDGNVLPHIQHLDRFFRMIGNGSVVVVAAPPVLLGVVALTILSAAATAAVVSSVRVYDSLMSLRRKEDVVTASGDGGQDRIGSEHAQSEHEGKAHVVAVAETEPDGEGTFHGGNESENSRGVETVRIGSESRVE